jgi:SH3-like domain-containing protein
MKKKGLFLVALILTLFIVLPVLAEHQYVVTANGRNLNVRKYASKGADVIDSIRYGTRVDVRFYEGSWCFITYGSRSGYVMSRFLKKSIPSGQYIRPAYQTYTTIPTAVNYGYNGDKMMNVVPYVVQIQPSRPSGRVAVRWSPTTQSEVVQYLTDGYQLTVTAQNRYWAQVRDENSGMVGYVYREFLRLSSVAAPVVGTYSGVDG